MDCPQCSGMEMEELATEDDLVFARCSECNGVWIDSGELSRALLRNRLPGLDALGGRVNLDEPAGTCAEDLADLMVIEASTNHAYPYAMCEVCGGVWLDNGGEGFQAEGADPILDEILEYFRGFAAAVH
ncbi:MAG: zf-TFIIB domain-containing protein [Deltaproteobacteria bacterium]|nr:zf-TFIIB domain-containing protein [Deltaproteobacteria bacterium]